MKVVITEKFKGAYQELFTKLQEALGTGGPSIQEDKLATYFAALSYAKTQGLNLSNKFYRLPLEEPPMTVNMDTRMITVPDHFKNNGLGVKGDSNAEIVFFKIPRWYDTMDLYPNQDIGTAWVVQWANGNNRKEENKMGNAPVVFTDAIEEIVELENGETEQHDYVLLGWVITDAMTEQSGNLEFALRFYTLKQDKNGDPVIDYSLATQKASCAIKGSLDLDVINADVDKDLENLIRSRPIYSGVINSMDGAAPTIILDLDNTTPYELSTEVRGYEDYAALTNTDGSLKYPDGIYRFEVEGTSPDQGDVVYRWYKGKEQLYDVLTGEIADDAEYVAVEAGTYFAQIGNKHDATGTRWINTKTAVIPAAADLAYGDVTKYPIMMYSLGADLEVGQEGHKNTLEYDVTGYNKASDVKYTWSHTSLDGKTTSVLTNGVTGNKCIPAKDLEGTISCTAINYRNNTQSKPLVVGTPCLVRAWPDKPTQVALEYTGDGALTAAVTFPAGSASALHGPDAEVYGNEWDITWTRETNLDGVSDAQQLVDKTLTIKPVLKTPTKYPYNVYTYRCKVAHKVFSKTNLEKVGETTQSKYITLKVAADGQVTVEHE